MRKELLQVVERLDSTTYNHSMRMHKIAKEYERTNQIEDDDLSTAALLHDIGKLYMPMSILDKRDKLTELEREVIDLHAYLGYRLLGSYDVSEEVRQLVLFHHSMEPMYLQEIKKPIHNEVSEKIILLRTLDVFEALTSDRAYKRHLPADQVIAVMEQELIEYTDKYHEGMLGFMKSYCK